MFYFFLKDFESRFVKIIIFLTEFINQASTSSEYTFFLTRLNARSISHFVKPMYLADDAVDRPILGACSKSTNFLGIYCI